MAEAEIKTFPHQRIIAVHKEAADKQHKYTVNTLAAIDEAAANLCSKGGFKLCFYLAKNQNQYSFALSSADFMAWSNLCKSAYTTAYNELAEKGYLAQSKT